MFKPIRTLGCALFTFALLTGQIARADDEKPVHLIVKPTVGRVTHTKSIVKVTLMGMEIEIQGVEKSTVTAVQENGDVVTEVVDEGSKMHTGGQEQDMPITPTYSVTHDKLGKTTKTGKVDMPDELTTPEINKLMNSITDIILTDKPLKPNDTWQFELENPAIKEKKVVVKSTYLGLDKINDKTYWKVKQAAEAIVNADGSKITYEVTEWIDPTSGDTIQLDGTVKDIPTKFGLMSMHVNAKNVKAGEKAQ